MEKEKKIISENVDKKDKSVCSRKGWFMYQRCISVNISVNLNVSIKISDSKILKHLFSALFEIWTKSLTKDA